MNNEINPIWNLIILSIFMIIGIIIAAILLHIDFYNTNHPSSNAAVMIIINPTIYNFSSTAGNITSKKCCYPKECEGLYNNSNCDNSCEYPVYCFTLKENETLEQHYNTINQ